MTGNAMSPSATREISTSGHPRAYPAINPSGTPIAIATTPATSVATRTLRVP